jgi:hypothetical protein
MPLLGVLFGAILGAAITYAPRWLDTKRKQRSYKESLAVEIRRCENMAHTFLDDNVPSPLYRLPLYAWSTAFPKLLGMGMLREVQVNKLYDFYIEVESLNRGLDQANAAINNCDIFDREINRNKLKANNIIRNFDEALKVIR